MKCTCFLHFLHEIFYAFYHSFLNTHIFWDLQNAWMKYSMLLLTSENKYIFTRHSFEDKVVSLLLGEGGWQKHGWLDLKDHSCLKESITNKPKNFSSLCKYLQRPWFYLFNKFFLLIHLHYKPIFIQWMSFHSSISIFFSFWSYCVQIREGRLQGVSQCLIREYRMICTVLQGELCRDFFEVPIYFIEDLYVRPT